MNLCINNNCTIMPNNYCICTLPHNVMASKAYLLIKCNTHTWGLSVIMIVVSDCRLRNFLGKCSFHYTVWKLHFTHVWFIVLLLSRLGWLLYMYFFRMVLFWCLKIYCVAKSVPLLNLADILVTLPDLLYIQVL